jgi:hypothetical protein
MMAGLRATNLRPMRVRQRQIQQRCISDTPAPSGAAIPPRCIDATLSLHHADAAIYRDGLAGDEACLWGAKERDGRGDLFRGAEASEWR